VRCVGIARTNSALTSAPVEIGASIASEGKGDYMLVEGCVLSTDGTPVPNAVIETWETDENGEHAFH
jgi:protocatechuate 3,4-dioxygenase beta subunit